MKAAIKNFFLKFPIRQKILTIIFFCSFLALITTLLFFILFTTFRLKENLEQEMNVLAEVIGNRSTAAIEFLDQKTAEENLKALSARTSVEEACIYDTTGQVFASYFRAPGLICPEAAFQKSEFIEGHLYVYRHITNINGSKIGTISLVSDLKDIQKSYQRYFFYSIISIIFGGLIALIISSRLARIIDKPIRGLYHAAKAVTDNADYNVHVKRVSEDELGVLVDAFNEMLLQIQIRDKEVKEANTNLEGKVLQRTAELEKAKILAERANESKSEFLANMSHELRTPMHAVLSFAEFGKTESETAPKEDLQKYFSKIENSGKRLLTLLNNLLDLSKLESGKMQFNIRKSNLENPLNSVLSEVQKLLEDKKLKVELIKLCDTTAFFDSEKMIQVFYNLLSNAIKFSKPEGAIKITMRQGDETIITSVEDQGIGIPEKELEAVFDKFVQSSKTKTGAGGTGLGLSIVKEIIRGHHGNIWASNATSGGAIFSFTLPINPIKYE